MKKLFALLFLSLSSEVILAYEREIIVDAQYLNFPISHSVDRARVDLVVADEDYCYFDIRIAPAQADYWVFQDVSALKGKKLKLISGSDLPLDRILLCDSIIGGDTIGLEPERPQYHFTSRRGWINDPNGLVWNDGVYHLFYQHNPYEREWGNMHWGHAISPDLVNWTELPDALHPDSLGTIFSGTALIDKGNILGKNLPDGTSAMVAFYTVDSPDVERQCMAYSIDNGMTFTKFPGNPVVDSCDSWKSKDCRDPKVFLHEPSGKWVMVLCERDGHTIYNSDNLIDWWPASHIIGFWECPELFELAVDGNSDETRWVLWGASGTYMTGSFDGSTFTPDGPKQCNLNGSAYAAQTFANEPSGRVVKIAWGRMGFGDSPFNGVMLMPQQQTLRRTPAGIKLFSYPVSEIDDLFTVAYSGSELSQDEANAALRRFDGNDLLHIHAVVEPTYATDFGLFFGRDRLFTYDMNMNRLQGEFWVPSTPSKMDMVIDIYVDRGVVEGFVDGGEFSYSFKIDPSDNGSRRYEFFGRELKIKQLTVNTMR